MLKSEASGRLAILVVVVLTTMGTLAAPLAADVLTPRDRSTPEADAAQEVTEADAAVATAAPEQAQPRRPQDEHDRGQAAIDRLGDRLPEVAATHGLTEHQLRESLQHDRTLRLDAADRLYYVEEAIPEAEEGAPAVPAGGTTSGDENRQKSSVEPPRGPEASQGPSPAAEPFPFEDTFALHSRSGSNRVIYLDFDGDSVTNTAWHPFSGTPSGDPLVSTAYDLDGNPAAFSTGEQEVIQSVWQRVSEDYAPFDVDVTTEYPGEAAIHRANGGDLTFGSHVVVAGTNPIAPGCGCGGIAYIGVFNSTTSHEYYQPAFVFQQGGIDTAKEIAEAASHEVGHNLGLQHDGTSSASYYTGHGSWAPIMGVGYNRPVVHWSKGEYPGANNTTQDDLVVIGSFGLDTIADDHGDLRDGTSTVLTPGSATGGRITTGPDADVFSFTAPGGLTTIQVEPAPVSPNLDLSLSIHSSGGSLVTTVDPVVATVSADLASGLGATAVIEDLPAGSYFATVSGVGADPDGNVGTHDGYSDYGSLGTYEITAGFGICGIDDDLADDDASTDRVLFPTEATDGKRCSADDDWLRVPGVSGTTVSATLAVQDDDLTLDLLGVDGTTVLDTAAATAGAAGEVSFTLPANGDHFLRVTGTGGAPTAESRYSLSTSFVTVCPPDDQYEAGAGDDTHATSVSMSLPSTKAGINCTGDPNGDFTQLALTAGKRIELTIDYPVVGGNDLALFVTRGSYTDLPTTWSENADGTFTASYTPIVSGNHQVWVYRWGGTAVPYELSVVEFPERAPLISNIFPSTGAPAGEEVFIVGSGFAGVTSITFDDGGTGVAATFAKDSDTFITATVPAAAVTGPVTVTNGAGSAQRAFTVLVGGRITGTLTGPAQMYDCVTVWDAATGEEVVEEYKQLDLDGSVTYETPFLEVGTYRISAGGCGGDTFRTYFDGASTFAAADDVAIVAGSNTSGIDLEYVPSKGSIAGTVTGSGSVDDICVTAISPISSTIVATTYTDEFGNFELTGLNSGTYHLGYACGSGTGDSAHMIEYWEELEQGSFTFAGASFLDVTAGGVTIADTALDDAAVISGHLTSSTGGDADGACVSAYEFDSDGPLSDSAFLSSDGTGMFSFPARVEGGWWLTFGECRPDGWQTLELSEPYAVLAGDTVDASQVLTPAPTGGISGIVTQEGGTPLQWICVDAPDGDEVVSDQTSSTGLYELYELAPGSYTVTASTCTSNPPNVLDASITVEVSDDVVTGDLETNQNITMLEGGAIEGTVSSTETGFPAVVGVCVGAYDGEGTYELAYTDSTGDFRIEQLDTGTYTVSFSGCDWDSVSWAYDEVTSVSVIRPSTTSGVNTFLDPGASLSGTVTESGELTPIGDMCVDLEQGTSVLSSTWTDFDGQYLFEDLAAGSYDLTVGGNFCDQQLYVPQTIADLDISAGEDAVQDAAMVLAGTITGGVSGADTVTITAWDATTEAYINSVGLEFGGPYELFVPAGDVKVSFVDTATSTTIWYGGTDFTDAATLTVPEGGLVDMIDADFTTTNPIQVDSFDPTSGPVGTEVTILGAGFTNAVDVWFNGTSASFTLVDDTEITATVPEGATDGVISVVTLDSSADSADSFDVIEANQPPIAYFESPAAADSVKGVVPLRVSATDAETSVARVELFVDSQLLGTVTEADGDGLWTYLWHSASVGDGQTHTIESIAYDTEDLASDPAQTLPTILSSAIADFDGDGTANLAVFRPSGGRWYINGVAGYTNWGTSTDAPVPADYTGDGVTDIAIFRPSNGRWYIQGIPGYTVWGQNGDITVPADYTGDGTTDIAIFRPASGRWYINGLPGSTQFGLNGDIPLPGDYDGDGTTDLAVFRPSNGRWYINGVAGYTSWGSATDIPVPADYDGDGTSDIAIFRPSNGRWYVEGLPGYTVWGGQNGDIAVPADYTGDGTTDIAIYRPSNGRWYIDGIPGSTQFGLIGDIPLAKRPGS